MISGKHIACASQANGRPSLFIAAVAREAKEAEAVAWPSEAKGDRIYCTLRFLDSGIRFGTGLA